MDALEAPIADAPRLIKLLNEIVDRALILRRCFGDACAVDVADGCFGNPGALGLGGMGVPFLLCPPHLGSHQNGEFGQARRYGRVETAVASKLLRELSECG